MGPGVLRLLAFSGREVAKGVACGVALLSAPSPDPQDASIKSTALRLIHWMVFMAFDLFWFQRCEFGAGVDLRFTGPSTPKQTPINTQLSGSGTAAVIPRSSMLIGKK